MKDKNKDFIKNIGLPEDFSLTREANLKNKSKWEVFLDGYKNHYKTDFSWHEYIKKCKLYYGEFNIKSFIESYGPECEADFKKFRGEVLEKKGIIKKSPYENGIINGVEFDEKILELMVNGDNLRTRMLISFLNPQTREEKKRLKKSWKKAKKQKQTKSEWMKTYVGIPFKPNELDPLDTKYTRDEIFEMIRDAKKRLNELKFQRNNLNTRKMNLDIETPSKSVSVSNISELEQLNKGINDLSVFQPTIKFDALTSNNTKDIREEFDISLPSKNSKTSIFKNFEDEDESPIIIQKATEPINIDDKNIDKSIDENLEIVKVTHELKDNESVIKIDEETNKNNLLNNVENIDDILTIEKSFSEQLQSVKEDNAKITQELQKVNQIKLEEEKKYEMLRKQREELTRKILENENLLK
ncbi:DUF5454 family protein [Mycoplasmoides pirum]|uniref:DUF5454 family protein n=1 Tax=Mycoplasmoides pirum TaxID=2122 RepID=UPI0006981522|nr:DUF5454 family protein [Mycoplasmoides pirum]